MYQQPYGNQNFNDQGFNANNFDNPYNNQYRDPYNYQGNKRKRKGSDSSSSSDDDKDKHKNVLNDMSTALNVTKNNQYQQFDNEPAKPFSYKNSNVRLNFIRKVYLILSAQLITTFVITLYAYLNESFRLFMRQNLWLVYVCAFLTIVLTYALVCYRKVARTVPINFILLFIFTLCESYIVAFITSMYEPQTVLIATALTAAIVIGLTLYAIFTKTDFTTCGGILVVCLVALIVGGIIGIFIKNKWFHLILSILGVILFGIYLVYDTQLTIGKNSRAYSIDDYIVAALNLYIDIIQIFLELLKIIGSLEN